MKSIKQTHYLMYCVTVQIRIWLRGPRTISALWNKWNRFQDILLVLLQYKQLVPVPDCHRCDALISTCIRFDRLLHRVSHSNPLHCLSCLLALYPNFDCTHTRIVFTGVSHRRASGATVAVCGGSEGGVHCGDFPLFTYP